MTDEELRGEIQRALGRRIGAPAVGLTDAVLPIVKRYAAEQLREAAEAAKRPVRRRGMNREEILRAVAAAAAEYRRVTGDSTEDLSLALALAELEFDDSPIEPAGGEDGEPEP